MDLRKALSEIDGLVLAFIGLTAMFALASFFIGFSFEARAILGCVLLVVLAVVIYVRNRRKRGIRSQL